MSETNDTTRRKPNYRPSYGDLVALAEWLRSKKEEIEAGKWGTKTLANGFSKHRGITTVVHQRTILKMCEELKIAYKRPAGRKYAEARNSASWMATAIKELQAKVALIETGMDRQVDTNTRLAEEVAGLKQQLGVA